MGRPGITYEMVEAAADALAAERPGSTPTLAAIRAHLGTGSLNTIHKFLRMWSENRPKAAAQVLAIPDEITKALSGWVVQQATGSRADAEERLVQAQAAADELARVGEDLEAERDQLLADIASLTTQRDQHQATAGERSAEIERLLAEVERERALAGAAQVDAAQARLRAESQVEHLAEMRTRVETLSAAVDAERTARTVAERDAAVGAVQLAGVRTELEAARVQVASLQQDLAAGRDRAEQARAGFDDRIQQHQDALEQLRADHKEEMNGVHRALDAAQAQLLATTSDKFKAEGQLLEAEQARQAVEKKLEEVELNLQAERAQAVEMKRMLELQKGVVARLEVDKATLRDQLAAAQQQGKQ